jgi:hypothetical protein
MGDPFAAMAAQLAGTPAPVAGIEAAADRLAAAAAWLREAPDPRLHDVADALDSWLDDGGDLTAALGVKPRRGRRHELPANRRKRQALAALLRGFVADENGRVEDVNTAARALAFVLRELHGVPERIRERTGAAPPTSPRRLALLLRDAES